MREQGVRGLSVACLNHGCRHELIFSADDYPGDTELLWFKSRIICSQCGGKRVDVRPNWNERAAMPTKAALRLIAGRASLGMDHRGYLQLRDGSSRLSIVLVRARGFAGLGGPSMARAKSAKQRRRKTALPAFGAAGVSLAMASGASANVAPATVLAHDPGAPLVITLAEEEIADVSLATFYVFDKENADIPEAGVQLARGCGCRGCGGRGCAVRGCGGCRAVACRGCGCRACRGCRGCGCGGCGCGGCGCCLAIGPLVVC